MSSLSDRFGNATKVSASVIMSGKHGEYSEHQPPKPDESDFVLVDRGVSLLPIHADVTGIRLDVAPGSIIEVHVPPYEADFCVELVQPGRQE